jgi:hypothetical protein
MTGIAGRQRLENGKQPVKMGSTPFDRLDKETPA